MEYSEKIKFQVILIKDRKHSCNQNELRTLNGGGRRDVMVSRVMAKFKDKWGWRISHSGKES